MFPTVEGAKVVLEGFRIKRRQSSHFKKKEERLPQTERTSSTVYGGEVKEIIA
jgi:hypothetical protein